MCDQGCRNDVLEVKTLEVRDMTLVEITMLGRFAVRVNGTEVPARAWNRRQAAGLVKLLALAPGRRLHREQVLDKLWRGVDLTEAVPRLHKAAHYARGVLGPGSVVLRHEMAVLFPDARVVVDALHFAELATDALTARGHVEAEQVLGAYVGSLLPDDVYEPWTQEHRGRLEHLYVRLLRQAQRWVDLVDLDPTDEQAHLALMRQYSEQGARQAALRQYERLEKALRRELGVGPGHDVLELRDALLATPPPTAGSPDAVPVGREKQLRELDRVLNEAAQGKGRTIFLAGPAGIGKSFLAQWLREGAASQGWRIGVGMASKVEGDWPYAPVLDAVADLCRHHPMLLDELDDRCREDIERALSGRDLDWSGDAAHPRLYVAVAELIRLASADTGALLTIDNVHEADEASLRLLHYLARTGMNDRFVLVLPHRRQPVTETFEQMRSSLLSRDAATDVSLMPLTRDDTLTLAKSLTSELELDADRAEQIWQLSAGVPFAIVEATRVPADGAGGAGSANAVLSLLDPQVRGVLERVAVTGSTFDTDEFVALSGIAELDAFDRLDAALAAMVVERTPKGYRFRHQIIREALLEAVPPHRQRLLHRECAQRLAAIGASPARVGHHWLAAGNPAAATPHVLRAAETEAAVGAYRDALALVSSIRHVARGADQQHALALRADLLAAVGDSRTTAAYREAIGAAASPQMRRLLKARLARMVAYGGDLATASALLADLELDGGMADSTIMLARGTVSYFSGDMDSAHELADRARSLVVNSDTDWQLLNLVALQGLVAHNRGEWFQQILIELRRTKDDSALATAVFDAHLCVAENLLYGSTPYSEVIELATALRASAERMGAMRAVGFASALMGEAALLAGDLDLAERQLRDSADLHREIAAPAGEAHALQRLAEVLLARGDRAGAARLLKRALPLARWSNMAVHLIHRIYGSMIAVADGPTAARAVVDQARATVTTMDRCFFCEVTLAMPAAIACADVGDIEDARAYLDVAERSAELWQATAREAGILEVRAHLARAQGDEEQAVRLLAEAAAVFEDAGQPRDAARCRG
jgi:DNA-binding SARP family transcriptional activator